MKTNKATVDVVDGIDQVFLTDRWGEFYDSPGVASTGLSADQIKSLAAQHTGWWSKEIAFLVHVREPFPDGGHLGIYCEFDIDSNWLSDMPLSHEPADAIRWRAALELFSPAIAHVAYGLRAIPGPAGQHGRCIFDLSSCYGGGICTLVPLCDAAALNPIFDLLFMNNISFPPSHHARLKATESMLWRYRPSEVPVSALPGTSLALPD